ncbi:MAG: tetratricopeptide repeat protein [bacterium]|nr:tetratricopeptide repeat protein [bacterium]
MWLRLLICVAMITGTAFADGTLVERAAAVRMFVKPDGSAPQTRGLFAEYLKALNEYQFDAFSAGLAGASTCSMRRCRGLRSLLRWYLLTEDLGSLKAWGDTASQREIPQAELALALLDFARADSLFRAARETADPMIQRRAKIGLTKVLHKQQKYTEAAQLLESAWTQDQLSDDVIFQMALTKIELGEISEATDLLKEALRWNPLHDMAHYFLGNGYSRKNYSELEGASPYLKCDGSGQCARDCVVDGSREWMRGEFESATTHFSEALKLVPDYGRAHNGIAKCLEQLRLRENVYRASDAKAFDAKPTPQVPQIEQYILNWESLSETHKKQVAISVEPWKAYVPVLVATGSHHYIKPLHEKLSEVPGLETIADQRISYDSRLWDDVRGCGGYTTVTGVEDVQRSIYNKYNTVLHELTHQVHGVFPPEDQQKINDLYREASARDAQGEEIFVSRYQGSSVWEYFAEGMNSYFFAAAERVRHAGDYQGTVVRP